MKTSHAVLAGLALIGAAVYFGQANKSEAQTGLPATLTLSPAIVITLPNGNTLAGVWQTMPNNAVRFCWDNISVDPNVANCSAAR